MQNVIKLYGSSGCPTCMGTKAYLEQRDVPFEYIDVRKNPEGVKELEELGIHTIPVITSNDKVVAGFSPKEIDKIIKEVLGNGND